METEKLEKKKKLEEYKKATSRRNKIIGSLIIVIIIIAVISGAFWWYLRTEDETVFTFAYQDRVADAASIVAVEKGYFKDEGLNIKTMVFSSGPACTEALTYGNAEFGTMGDTTGIITTSNMGDSFKIICSHGGGEHRHRIIVQKEGGINSIDDLEGKKIAVKKGTSTHGGLMLFADNNGLNLNDEIVDMKPSLQLTALAAGEVDAIVASEPTPSQAEAGGYGVEFGTLGGLNNTYPILILVSIKFANKHPDIVVKFLRALIKATEFIKNNPDEAAAIQSQITGLDANVIKNAMSYHYYDASMTQNTKDSLGVTGEFLKDIGKIDTIPDWNKVIDTSYLVDAAS